jgi:hypothetical protein
MTNLDENASMLAGDLREHPALSRAPPRPRASTSNAPQWGGGREELCGRHPSSEPPRPLSSRAPSNAVLAGRQENVNAVRGGTGGRERGGCGCFSHFLFDLRLLVTLPLPSVCHHDHGHGTFTEKKLVSFRRQVEIRRTDGETRGCSDLEHGRY